MSSTKSDVVSFIGKGPDPSSLSTFLQSLAKQNPTDHALHRFAAEETCQYITRNLRDFPKLLGPYVIVSESTRLEKGTLDRSVVDTPRFIHEIVPRNLALASDAGLSSLASFVRKRVYYHLCVLCSRTALSGLLLGSRGYWWFDTTTHAGEIADGMAPFVDSVTSLHLKALSFIAGVCPSCKAWCSSCLLALGTSINKRMIRSLREEHLCPACSESLLPNKVPPKLARKDLLRVTERFRF